MLQEANKEVSSLKEKLKAQGQSADAFKLQNHALNTQVGRDAGGSKGRGIRAIHGS